MKLVQWRVTFEILEQCQMNEKLTRRDLTLLSEFLSFEPSEPWGLWAF